MSLCSSLESEGVVGIYGIDTRVSFDEPIREKGSCLEKSWLKAVKMLVL